MTESNFARKMASGNLKAALCSVLTDYDHLDGVGRCKQAKDDVRKFMTAVMKNDSLMDIFDEFASNLIKELEKCFFSFFFLQDITLAKPSPMHSINFKLP